MAEKESKEADPKKSAEKTSSKEAKEEEETRGKQSEPTRGQIAFGGAGYGLLLGAVLGLSLQPVAATMVTALLALLGGVVGLRKKEDSALPNTALRYVALGAFGIACTISLTFGMYLRSKQAFSPTPKERYERWTAIGVSADEARRLVLAELRMPSSSDTPSAAEDDGSDGGPAVEQNEDAIDGGAEDPIGSFGATNRQSQTGLFSGETAPCDDLTPLPDSERLASLAESTESEMLQRMSAVVGALPVEEQASAIRTLVDFVCSSDE